MQVVSIVLKCNECPAYTISTVYVGETEITAKFIEGAVATMRARYRDVLEAHTGNAELEQDITIRVSSY